MFTIQEMNQWDYQTAWKFFSTYALNKYIPETQDYIFSLPYTETIDIRNNSNARNIIVNSITPNTLVFIDGSSLNGKSTFATRLAKIINAEIVDIDLICKDWIEKKLKEQKTKFEEMLFLMNADKLTDIYILENLENIIKKKSNHGKTVILVSSYIQIIYRSIVVKTLGKYFDNVTSIYACAKTEKEILQLLKKREEEYGKVPNQEKMVLQEYELAKHMLEPNPILLGGGMKHSYIIDIHVSDMFI